MKDGNRLQLKPEFPEDCRQTKKSRQIQTDAVIEHWLVTCPPQNRAIRIHGLKRTLTNVYVDFQPLNGNQRIAVIQPTTPTLNLDDAVEDTPLRAYFRIGVEHIVFGFDHLLFVVGLCLLVRVRQLFIIITAFTAAHTLTLALATLANIRLPGPPVEAVIALSIVFLAREVITTPKNGNSLTRRYPWAVAFSFGLIHGFGFAGALHEIGLPQDQEIWALGLFNLGVEAGQIVFVLVLLSTTYLLALIKNWPSVIIQKSAGYFMGLAGSVWFIERVLNFPLLS